MKNILSQIIDINKYGELDTSTIKSDTLIDKGVYFDVYKNQHGKDSKVPDGYSTFTVMDIEDIPLGDFIESFNGECNIDNGKMMITVIPNEDPMYKEERDECVPYTTLSKIQKIRLDDKDLDNVKIIKSEFNNQYETICGSPEGILVEDSLYQLFDDNDITVDNEDECVLTQNGNKYGVKTFIGREGSSYDSLHYDFRCIKKLPNKDTLIDPISFGK